MVCSENMFQLEPYQEHMWTPGMSYSLTLPIVKVVIHTVRFAEAVRAGSTV